MACPASTLRPVVLPAALIALTGVLPAAAADQPVTLRATLAIEQSTGGECPPPARVRDVVLVAQQGAPLAATLFVGDELVKSTAGDASAPLRLRDALLPEADTDADTLVLDRWPDPTSARIAFSFPRLACRVTAGRLAFVPPSAGTDPRAQTVAAIAADMALLGRIDAAGRRAEAAAVYQRLVALLGADHAIAIEARIVELLHAQDTGDLERATAIGDELLDRVGRLYGADSGPVARVRAARSFTHWRAGRSGAAITDTEAALATLQAVKGRAHRDTLVVQRRLAEYLLRSSRVADALEVAAQADATSRAAYGEVSVERIEALLTLFRANLIGGQSEDTRRTLVTMLPLARQKYGPDHRLYTGLVDALAGAAGELRLFDEASAAAAFVLRYRENTLGPNNPFTISARVNVALSLARQGRLDEAEQQFLEAYRRLPHDGTRHEAYATIEQNLAQLHLDRGDLAAAGPYADRAVERTLAYYGGDDARTLRTRVARAEWQRRTGDPAAALPVLEDVYTRQTRVGGTQEIDALKTLSEMAQAHRALREPERAVARLEELVRRAEALRAGVAADAGSRRDRFSRWVADYKRLALLEAGRARGSHAFDLAELSKGRTLLDQMSEQAARTAGELSAETQQALKRAALEITALEERLAAAAPASTEAADLLTALVEKRAAYLRSKEAVAAAHPRYAAMTRLAFVDATKAAALLARDEAAVSYLVGDEGVLVFVLDRGGLATTVRPWTAVERLNVDAFVRLAGALPAESGARLWQLENGTRAWAATRPAGATGSVGAAQLAAELGAWLLDPLKPALRGKRRILVSPDGPLAGLPFETLVLDGQVLVERYEVAYTQSLSVYARVLERARPPQSSRRRPVLAIGAPTFAPAATAPEYAEATRSPASRFRSAGLAWEPLPEARREIASIARTFPGTRTLVGDDASEDRLQALDASGELATYRTLHFATHAFFSSDRPELSAIVLRQPGSERADGFVTVAELPRYRLASDLTVLSACETAAGRVVDGEGVMGFAYALLVAGNRSTLAALWKVPDGSTRVFMEHFFAALRGGASQPAALARAKRALRAMPRYAAPLHWAGFVLYGR